MGVCRLQDKFTALEGYRVEARNWLEDYLDDYPGIIILVSHDRYFLDKVTHRITEIEHGSMIDYHSAYSGYIAEKEARYERLVARAKRQQDEIKRIQTFIDKFRYDKRRASLVQSREKMLEKVDIIHVPPRPKKIHLRIAGEHEVRPHNRYSVTPLCMLKVSFFNRPADTI